MEILKYSTLRGCAHFASVALMQRLLRATVTSWEFPIN